MDFSTKEAIVNTRIKDIRPIIPPACIVEMISTSTKVNEFVFKSRQTIADIIHGRDDRMIAVIGPCSIHDVKAAMEYARKLKTLADEVKNEVFIVMRVYFEKPRTTIGWKGMINDPMMDGSYQINTGIQWARQLMVDLNELGLPVGTEWLDTTTPQFISDLVSWGAIGARTSESQIHRQLVSGLSMPVGFKNGTTGLVSIAANGVISARSEHSFVGATLQGLNAIVRTKGNMDCHVILRGGTEGPNHTHDKVMAALETSKKNNVDCGLLIDISHGNSGKDYAKQPEVLEVVAKQIEDGNEGIVGIMCESNLVEGKQKLVLGKAKELVYGKSITDGCVSFETSETLIRSLANAVTKRRAKVGRRNCDLGFSVKPMAML